MTTYGTLRFGTTGIRETPAWGLDVEPHIAMKVKRVFARTEQYRSGTIIMVDTPEVARELEWFLQRYPLDMAEETRTYLTERADEHRAKEDAIAVILNGGAQMSLTGWQEPTRPSREYQTQAADMAWTVRGMIIGDDLGLGKTQSALGLLRDPDTLPALIVVPTHLPKQWQRELAEVFPMLRSHIVKTTKPYPVDADVVIMSYSKLVGWRDHFAGQIKTVIFDEVQELRKGTSQKYDAAQHIADKAEWRLGCTATPVYNYGDEVHTIYEVIAPGVLGSRDEFLREWGGRSYGDNVAVKDPRGLGGYLRDQGIMLRRTRKDVHREIPDPIKILQEVPANADVIEEIKGDLHALAALLVSPSAEAKDRMRAAGEINWKLRQATGIAKAPAVAEFVRLILESERSVVLAGWHRSVYDIWNHMLAEFNPLMYTGSETPAMKDRMAQAFISGESRILTMSLRSGSGLDGLQKACSCAVFGELDWSPAMHDQLIGRLNRDGQESTVAAYFCVTGSGSDPAIADVLELKQQQGEGIRNPDSADDALFGPNIGMRDISRTQRLLEAVGIR